MTDTIEQVLRQEDALLHAKRTLDIAALDHIYSDDLLMTGVMGEPTCTKEALTSEMKRGITERETAAASGRHIEMSVEHEDMKVSAHGDTAITNYRLVVKAKGPDVDVHHRYRATNVWLKRDGRWQIVAGHTAFVLDPKQTAILAAGGR